MNGTLRIRMLSEWAVSTGESAGMGADNTILRDEHGLPYIPGSSIRGLLRDAVLKVKPTKVHELFGQAGKDHKESETGLLKVSNATLSKGIVEAYEGSGLTRREIGEMLTLTRAQTAINEKTGAAMDRSLRSSEFAAPGIEFVAEVRADNQEAFVLLQEAALLIRRLGHSRARGFGYCEAGLLQDGEGLGFEKFRQECLKQTGVSA